MTSHVASQSPVTPKSRTPSVLKSFLRRLVMRAFRRCYEFGCSLAEADLPAFANQPKQLRIELPRRLAGTEFIHVGDGVSLGPGCLLVAQDSYPTEVMQHPERRFPVQHFRPKIVIGHRVTSTAGLTIDAMQEVVIEDDVMFASNVIVMDGLHGFRHTNEPYKYQPMWRIAPVVIGRGSWIAQNVVIMPGVRIGEMSIIGANSIVTHDVPPRSIAFGNPARVVKRWDEGAQCWVAVGAAPGG